MQKFDDQLLIDMVRNNWEMVCTVTGIPIWAANKIEFSTSLSLA